MSSMRSGSAPIAAEQVDSLLQVIHLVRTGQAVTRPELARRTGLGRSIVEQRVEQARDLDLLQSGELGVSRGGRAPRELRFPDDRGRLVAITFGAQNLTAAVADLAGDELWSDHVEWDIATGPEASLRYAADRLEGRLSLDGRPVWGVAVGLPGPVEFRTGRPMAPPIMPGWDGFDVRAVVEERFAAPTWVDNDVNLLARGESTRTVGSPPQDLVFVKIGTGIGAGIVAGGQILRGLNGAAGDIGHIRLADHADAACRCGRYGCLEAVAGGWALALEATSQGARGTSPFAAARLAERGELTAIDVAEGAKRGDAVCVGLVDRCARLVGSTIAELVNVLNPERVVLGGSIADGDAGFLATVRQTVYGRSLPLATRDLRIVAAATGHRSSTAGAFALIRSELFGSASMRSWVSQGTPLAVAPARFYEMGPLPTIRSGTTPT